MQAWAGMESKRGEPKRAQRLFEAAAKAEPDSAMLLNTWATHEKRRGNPAKAKELYHKALQSDASHVPSVQVSLMNRFLHKLLHSCIPRWVLHYGILDSGTHCRLSIKSGMCTFT